MAKLAHNSRSQSHNGSMCIVQQKQCLIYVTKLECDAISISNTLVQFVKWLFRCEKSTKMRIQSVKFEFTWKVSFFWFFIGHLVFLSKQSFFNVQKWMIFTIECEQTKAHENVIFIITCICYQVERKKNEYIIINPKDKWWSRLNMIGIGNINEDWRRKKKKLQNNDYPKSGSALQCTHINFFYPNWTFIWI